MKKALIAIITTIYIVALVIVAFLGSKAEVTNHDVEITGIYIENTNLPYPEYTNTTATSYDQRVVSVYKRPDDSLIDPETGLGPNLGPNEYNREIQWNPINDIPRNYAIMIENYRFLYFNYAHEYALQVVIEPLEASHPTLKYEVTEKYTKDGVDRITIENEKIIFGFAPDFLDKWYSTDIIISSTDHTGIKTKIQLSVHV